MRISFLSLAFLLLAVDAARASDVVVLKTCRDLVQALTNKSTSASRFDLTGKLSLSLGTNDPSVVLKDASGVACITRRPLITPGNFRAGDVLQVQGNIYWDKFDDSVRSKAFALCLGITVIRHEDADPLPAITSADLYEGRYDCQAVHMTGLVSDVVFDDIDPNYRFVILLCDSHVVYVPVRVSPDNTHKLDNLIGTQVSVLGICTTYTTKNRIFQGRHLSCLDPSCIRILTSEGADSVDIPTIDQIGNVMPSEIPNLGKRSAKGTVLAVWGAHNALIRLSTHRFSKVEFKDDAVLPHVGSTVEAVGFPESDLFRINLIRAVWRPIPVQGDSSSPCPTAIDGVSDLRDHVTPGQYNVNYYGKTLKLRGIVRQIQTKPKTEEHILLECNEELVRIDTSQIPDCVKQLSVGCEITVTGICMFDIEAWKPNAVFPRIKGVFLVTRTPADIQVVAQPSWWTPGRIWGVVAAMAAGLIAILIWNAALRIMVERRGRELFREQLGHVKADLRTEERTRLAVELHDTLAQNLTGVSMEIEAANDLRGNAPQPMIEHLGIAAKALKSCRDELRNCLWDLRSQALDEKDMTTAILRTLQPHVNDSRLTVRFNVPRSRLSDNTTHALLRIIRELVINAIRHGNAGSIKVAGIIEDDKLLCSVKDNGIGFDPNGVPGVPQGHFGLQGIRERVDDLGGGFSLASATGTGTKATVSIPVPREP